MSINSNVEYEVYINDVKIDSDNYKIENKVLKFKEPPKANDKIKVVRRKKDGKTNS